MSWIDIVQIAGASIVSAGGIGGIIIGVVSFSANKIADRMDEKFRASLDKQLEKYKSELSKKEYVSKTKFDTEFRVYRELSSDFAEMVKSINILIPFGLSKSIVDEKVRREHQEKCYNSAHSAFVKAQNTLNTNIPFISEEIFNGYNELLNLSNFQLEEYEKRNNVLDFRKDKKEKFSSEAYERTQKINEEWEKLNKKIRAYISKLDVMDDK